MMLENLIRGGQITAHKYRMGRQIVRLIFWGYLLLAISLFGFLTYQRTTSYEWYLVQAFYKARAYEAVSFAKKPQQDNFFLPNGAQIKIYPKQITQNRSIQISLNKLWMTLASIFKEGFLYGLFGFIVMLLFFIVKGRTHKQKTKERGGALASLSELTLLIKSQKQDSDLKLDTLPLIKDKETGHLLITGTTGAGKTNCFNTIIPQVRNRGDKAIIVDLTGSFVDRYYNPDTDIILNPYDDRSKNWNPWLDCLNPAHYQSLAKSLIAGNSKTDHFWDKAARTILFVGLQKFAETQDPKRLYEILVSGSLKKFEMFFNNTEAASYTSENGERMTLSVRANMATQLLGFSLLKKTDSGFSFRKWIANPTSGWLFLLARPDQREALLPLISAWVDLSMNSLMSLNPDEKRRVWYFIDELPALQELPSLKTLLAESRKYGGCVMAGIQNIQQLWSTYGHDQGQMLLDLFSTYIFFRTTNPETTRWISQLLGEVEETESQENLSYGAHEMRDGISLSKYTKIKSLVMPTEISQLRDLEAFVKLPGAYPVTKVRMGYR